jgi:hypothetical protein
MKAYYVISLVKKETETPCKAFPKKTISEPNVFLCLDCTHACIRARNPMKGYSSK